MPLVWNGMTIYDFANALGRHPNGEPFWLPYTRIVRAHRHPFFGRPSPPGVPTLRHGQWFTAVQVQEGMPDPLNAGPDDYFFPADWEPVPAAAREYYAQQEREAAAAEEQQQEQQQQQQLLLQHQDQHQQEPMFALSPPPPSPQQQQEDDDDDEEGGEGGGQSERCGPEQAQEQEPPRAPAPVPARQLPPRAARSVGEDARRRMSDGAEPALVGEEPAADGKAAAPKGRAQRTRDKVPCPVSGCGKGGDARHVMTHTRDCRVQPCGAGNPTFATVNQLGRHLVDHHNGGVMEYCQFAGCPRPDQRRDPKDHRHHLRLHNHNFGVGQGGPVAQNPDEDNGGDGGEEGSGGDEVEGDDEEDEDEEE